MRSLMLACVIGLSLLWADPVGARSNIDNIDASGSIQDGTPTAVVVRGATGDLGGYERKGGGSGPRWTCGYYTYNFPSDVPLSAWGRERHDPKPGIPYIFFCADETERIVRRDILVYREGDPLNGLFAAERAAEEALEGLVLPDPDVLLNPPGTQVVGLPTWLAVGGDWSPRAASAAIAGVSATVTAVPTSVAWDLGDGRRVTCDGPGTRFDPARPVAEQSSRCTHVYTWPSHAQPGGAYRATATTTYAVSWTATTGAAGDLGPVTRTSAVAVPVEEVQAVGH